MFFLIYIYTHKEFDFTPSFQFAISFDFNLVFSWPTNLTLDVQIVMAYSLSMLFFDRFIDVVWIIHLYMKRFQPNEKLFDYSTKILLIPYLFGEKFLNGFEIGWECLVIGYAIAYAFGYGIFQPRARTDLQLLTHCLRNARLQRHVSQSLHTTLGDRHAPPRP